DVGDRAVGDPELGTVQDVAVALTLGARLHPARVGAVVGLGETEAADLLAPCHRGEPRVLLRVGAIGVDRVHHQAALHRRGRAQARIAPLEFLHDQPVCDVAEPGAAVAFERGAEHAELAKLGNELDGKRAGAVMVGDQRQELGLDPVADRVAYHTLVFGQETLDRIVVDPPKLLHPRISLSLCDAAPSGAPRARRPARPPGRRRVRHGAARSSGRTGRPRPEKLGPRSRARRPRAPRSPTRSGSRSTRRRRRPPPAPPSDAGGPRATPAGTCWSRSPAAPRPHSTRRAPRGRPILETSDTPRSALSRPRARASSGTGPGRARGPA